MTGRKYTADLVRKEVGTGKPFRLSGTETYVMHKSGAFVRTDKDRRSAKERKRARRLEREQKATA